jgi:hypothetical protein
MMRFPALLAAKLAKARIARIFKPGAHTRLVTFVDPGEVLHPGSAHPVSHEKIRQIISSPAAMIWIGGSEPLDHPGIAHLVRALAPSGHFIFLETNGTLLRRRIHEFPPLPRLFLAVRLDAAPGSAADPAVEGLCAARLSGFFTAVHSQVGENSDLADLARLRIVLLEKDVDGWLLTSSPSEPAGAGRTAKARTLIPSAAWRRFSKMLEFDLHALGEGREAHGIPVAENPKQESCEESVKVA